MILALILACAHAPPPVPIPPPVEAGRSVPIPSGQVVEGRFVDAVYGLSIAVPEGWVAILGQGDGPFRVRLDHAATGVRLEVWSFPGELGHPRPRSDCTWSFSDTGPYRTLAGTGSVTVATCLPDDPARDRVFAWLVGHEGRTWDFELRVPGEVLADGQTLGEEVLRTVRW